MRLLNFSVTKQWTWDSNSLVTFLASTTSHSPLLQDALSPVVATDAWLSVGEIQLQHRRRNKSDSITGVQSSLLGYNRGGRKKCVAKSRTNIDLSSAFRHILSKWSLFETVKVKQSRYTPWIHLGERSASRPGRVLPQGKVPPVPIVQEAGWAPEIVWTQKLEEKLFYSAGDRTSIARSPSP
jgi:hypothetical protein